MIKSKVNLRGGSPGRASVILDHVVRLLSVIAFFSAVSAPSTALAQTATTPNGVPPAVAAEWRRTLENATGGTLTEHCQPLEGYTCVEVQDSILVPSLVPPVYTQVASDATEAQAREAIQQSVCELRHDFASTVHAFNRRFQRDEREMARIGHQSEVTRIQVRELAGCGPNMSDQDCLAEMSNWNEYWTRVLPAVTAARNALVDERQAQMRAELEAVQRDIVSITSQLTQLRTDLGNETAARIAADNALNARITAAQLHRLSATLFAGATHISAGYTGGLGGFSLMARPWDAPVIIAGRFSFGYGETSSRGAFLFTGDLLGGFDWGSGRVLGGVSTAIAASSKWKESMILSGAGPMVRVEFDLTSAISVGGSVSAIIGDGINPSTGIGQDVAAWSATLDVGVRLGNWFAAPSPPTH